MESALWLALVEDHPKALYKPIEWTIEKSRTDLYKIARPSHSPCRCLLAIRMKHQPEVAEDYTGTEYDDGSAPSERKSLGILRKWNLRDDDLEQQSQQTITFFTTCSNEQHPIHIAR
jgi:hypothetical protein